MTWRQQTFMKRFPVLARLGRATGGAIAYQQQTSAADCGAACLTMVLGLWRKYLPLDEVRSVVAGDQGAEAFQLLQAARHFGLRGRGVKVERIDDLARLSRGAILHWRFNHFVVFDRVVGTRIEIVDPALGRRTVSRDEVSRSFTGIALTFEPSSSFSPESRRATGLLRHLRPMLARAGRFGRVVAISAVLQVLALALPLLTALVVDRVIPRGDERLLMFLGIGVVAIAGYRFACALLRAHMLLQLRSELDAQLTLFFLDHLVNLPYAFFTQRTGGDLMMRVNSNTTIRETLTSGMLSALLDGTLVSVYLVALLVTDLRLGVLVVVLGFLRTAIFWSTRRRHRELMAESLQAQAASRGYLVEVVAGIETLKAAGVQDRAVDRWSDLFVDELNVSIAQGRLQALVTTTLDTLAVLSPLVVLVAGSQRVLAGDLSLGTMLAAGALAAGFLEPLSTLVTNALDLQRLTSYLERINEVLDTPREIDPPSVSPPGGLSGKIAVRQLSFRYGPRSLLALEEISFAVEPGQLVAIVGRSGSGKSTLGAMLVGLYRPESGQVFYDGIDLARLDLDIVRRQLGIVTQRAYLFGASIRNNIALNQPEAPLRSVMEAARRAAVHDEIQALPMGYETVLADGGATLSGGQRQRIAIARAILPRPRIMLLDEATSALDSVTEAAVHAELRQLRATRIVIAHRLSTVIDADLILVLDEGRLVEHGKHEALVARGGLYAMLAGADHEVHTRRAAG